MLEKALNASISPLYIYIYRHVFINKTYFSFSRERQTLQKFSLLCCVALGNYLEMAYVRKNCFFLPLINIKSLNKSLHTENSNFVMNLW